MANISQNVNIEMLEKLPDGTYKRKYPKTTKEQVGLDEVDNVKQIPLSEKGQPNGVATLGEDGFLDIGQLEGLKLLSTTTTEQPTEQMVVAIPEGHKEIQIVCSNLGAQNKNTKDGEKGTPSIRLEDTDGNQGSFGQYLKVDGSLSGGNDSILFELTNEANEIRTGGFVMNINFEKMLYSLSASVGKTFYMGALRHSSLQVNKITLEPSSTLNEFQAGCTFEIWGDS